MTRSPIIATTINTDNEMTGLELNKRIQELQEQDEKIQQLMKAFGTQPRNATLRLNSGEGFRPFHEVVHEYY